MQTFTITFLPDNISIDVEMGTTILDAAHQAKIPLKSPCGGKNMCKKCLVQVGEDEKILQACQYHINSDLTVTIPSTSYHWSHQILQSGIDIQVATKNDPAVVKKFIKTAEPSLEDLRSDEQRLLDELTKSGISTPRMSRSLLCELPGMMRNNDFSVMAVIFDNQVIALEEGDTTNAAYGLVVDIGTTTVVATLLNLNNGQVTAIAADGNPQAWAGDDVVSRIHFAGSEPEGLQRLHQSIIDGINRLADAVCRKGGVNKEQIYDMVVGGNATMQHLFLGVPVEQIAYAPYVAAFSHAVVEQAARLGIEIHPEANVFVMPGVAGHIGGDTVAVALAMMMDQSSKVSLALDIGTNGELVLGNRDKLLTCSTAAGPAMEGARIMHGMRAANGAIEKVSLNTDVKLSVIGQVPPVGICGSGLVDAVAELYRMGLIDQTGRMLTRADVSGDLPDGLAGRMTEYENMPAFVLATAEQSGNREPVLLTQKDIRETQLAIAAIRAGIRILMNQLEVGYGDIEYVYLAGAFSNYVRPESAGLLGLIPKELSDRIRPVGNAVSTGIKRVLMNRQVRQYAEEMARKMTYVELAGKVEFQEVFSESLIFPELE